MKCYMSRWPLIVASLMILCGFAAGFPNVVQEHYQWMNDDGMEADATTKANADTALQDQLRTETLRLRFALANTDTLGNATGVEPRLEFSTNRVDLYAPVQVNPGAGQPFEMVTTVHYTNNVTLTTARLAASGTFLSGGFCVESNANTASPFDILATRYVNVEYCFRPTSDAASGVSYYFRVTDMATGSPVPLEGGYEEYAELTLVGPPQVDNDGGPTDVTATSAKLHGQINDTGGITPTATFYWGSFDGDTNKSGAGAWENSEPMGLRAGSFSKELTGLQANQDYYYRTYATNAAGDAWAAATANFTTDPPDVSLVDTFRVVDETGISVTIDVSLADKSALPVSVNYGTQNGSAVAGSDYTNFSGTINWPADTDGAQSITVYLMDDSTPEPNELFYVVLSAPSDCDIVGTTTCTVSVIDDDGAPTLQFTQSGSSGNESISPTNLYVTLSGGAPANTKVKYKVVGGTAQGTDYTLTNGTLSVNTGATSTNLVLQINEDTEYEPNETVIVQLYDPEQVHLGFVSNFTYTIEDTDIGTPEVDNWIGASRIRATNATLRGRVLDTRRQDPTVYVYWGETNGDTNKPGSVEAGRWSNVVVVGSMGVDTFETNITSYGLTTDTLYYYRCYASNDAGGAWADGVENFFTADPPAFPLLSNESMEDMGANETTPAHWQPSPGVVRTNEFPRTGSYACRMNNAAKVYVAGVDDNHFRNTWNGQFFTGTPHPSGGIRPGFVLRGNAYMRAREVGSDGATILFGIRNYTDDSNWPSNNLFTNNVVYQEISVTNDLPMPGADVNDRMGPVILRDDTGGATEERYHVDDLSITVSLPKLKLTPTPTNPVVYAPTPYGLSSDTSISASSQGGETNTVLYGAYVSGAADLVNPNWNCKAWQKVYDSGTNAFAIVGDDTLVVTNDLGPKDFTFRFTPPGEGVYTGVVRVATTDPNDHYLGSGGELSPYNIQYERFILIGTGTTARTLSISDESLVEGDSGTQVMTFTLTMSSTAPTDVTVQYDTANGSAQAGTDYVAASDMATITAGNTSTNILVTINGDSGVEPTELFYVNLSTPVGATIADGQGEGTIQNDDGYTGPNGAVFRVR
jgi:hypothetical protein